MERLTIGGNSGGAIDCKKCPKKGSKRDCYQTDCEFILANRLKSIEDILGPTYDLSRLKELVEADREGRCVVLPCKVVIYLVDGDGTRELTVDGITCGISGVWKVHAHTDKSCTLWKAYEIRLEAFGKTVFLTREAAEKAMEDI